MPATMLCSNIALEVADRDEWLILADLKRKGVEIVQGPLIHGPEGARRWAQPGWQQQPLILFSGPRWESAGDLHRYDESSCGRSSSRAEYAEVFKK